MVMLVALLLFAGSELSLGQPVDNGPGPKVEGLSKQQSTEMIPLIALQPGESTELLMTTWCTLDYTRGGGLGLAEMIDGKPNANLFGGRNKTYERDGVKIVVPDFEQAIKAANQPQYAALGKQGLGVFSVKVTADKQAKPGLFEMHLVDSTCSGNCSTDFRVLITAPVESVEEAE